MSLLRSWRQRRTASIWPVAAHPGQESVSTDRLFQFLTTGPMEVTTASHVESIVDWMDPNQDAQAFHDWIMGDAITWVSEPATRDHWKKFPGIKLNEIDWHALSDKLRHHFGWPLLRQQPEKPGEDRGGEKKASGDEHLTPNVRHWPGADGEIWALVSPDFDPSKVDQDFYVRGTYDSDLPPGVFAYIVVTGNVAGLAATSPALRQQGLMSKLLLAVLQEHDHLVLEDLEPGMRALVQKLLNEGVIQEHEGEARRFDSGNDLVVRLALAARFRARRAEKDQLWAPDPEIVKNTWRRFQCTVCGNVQAETTNHLGAIMSYCKKCSWAPSKGECYNPMGDGRCYRKFTYMGEIDERHQGQDGFWDSGGEAWSRRGDAQDPKKQKERVVQKRTPVEVLFEAGFSDPQMLIGDLWTAFTKSGAREHRDHHITSVHLTGSRWKGDARDDSDLDVVVFHSGNALVSEANQAFRARVAEITGGRVDAFLLPSTEAWDHPMSGNIMTLTASNSTSNFFRAGERQRPLLSTWLEKVAAGEHDHRLTSVKNAILELLRQGPKTMAGVQDVLYTRGVSFHESHAALAELMKESLIRKDDTARVSLVSADENVACESCGRSDLPLHTNGQCAKCAGPGLESEAKQFNHLVKQTIFNMERELRENGPRDPANLVALMMKPWGGIDPKFFQGAYEKALDHLEKAGKIEWSEAENAWKIPGTGRDVPETPADVPGMKPGERQQKIDALLDRWNREPEKRPQIEEQLKSLRAFSALFMLRVAVRPMKNLGPALDRAQNMFGPLKPDIRKRILNFLQNPTADSWDDIQSIIISGFGTIWQGMLEVDPSFPRSGRSTDQAGNVVKEWERIPTPEQVLQVLEKNTGGERQSLLSSWNRRRAQADRHTAFDEHLSMPIEFEEMPAPFQAAITQYFGEGEGDVHAFSYKIGRVPLDKLAPEIMAKSDLAQQSETENFEGYHRWYTQPPMEMPDYSKQSESEQWPVILQPEQAGVGFEVIEDGWHRFHDYVRNGAKTIPAVFLVPKEQRQAEGADPAAGPFNAPWPDQIQAFMQAVYDQTAGHPFTRGQRVWNGSVIVEVHPWRGGPDPEYPWIITLKWLQSMEPGKGNARECLAWLSALADEYGVPIDLHAKPTGEPKIPKPALKNLYKDHGFERDRGQGPDDMVRHPKLSAAWRARRAAAETNVGTIDYRGKSVPVMVPTQDLAQWLKLRVDDRIIRDPALGKQFTDLVARIYDYAAAKIEPNANIRESQNISLYPDIERCLEYFGYAQDEVAQGVPRKEDMDARLREAAFAMFEQHRVDLMGPVEAADLLMNMAVVLHEDLGMTVDEARTKLSSLILEWGGGPPENVHLNSMSDRWRERRAEGEQKLLRELICTVIGSDSGTTNEAVLPAGAVVGVQPWSNDHTIFFYSPIYSKIIVRGRVMKSNQYSAPVQEFRAATDIGYGEGTGYEHGPECFCDECTAKDDMSTHRCPSCGSRECPGDGHTIDCRKPGTMTIKDVPTETKDSLLDKFNRGEIDEKTLRRRMKQISSSVGSMFERWVLRLANDPLKKIIEINGVKVGIEWPKGSTRTWKHLPGNDYEKLMKADYGYIRQTEGEDGEEIDVYAGPDKDSDLAFVVTQLDKKTGEYDEDKIMLGYSSEAEAKASYLEHMEKAHFGGIKKLSWDEFLKLVPKSQRVKEKTAAMVDDPGSQMVLIDDLRIWDRASKGQGDHVESMVLPKGTTVKVVKKFRLDHGGSPELLKIMFWPPKGKAGAGLPTRGSGVVRADDLRFVVSGGVVGQVPEQSKPATPGMIEEAIINLLRAGPSTISSDLSELNLNLSTDENGKVDEWDAPFSDMVQQTIGKMLDRGMIRFDGGTAEFSLLKEPEPTRVEHVPEMSPTDAQSKIDALLDQLAVEQDPKKKQQIEQRIRSLSATTKDIWRRRAGDTMSIDEQRSPGVIGDCAHEWPGKKPGERGWCGRCRL